MPITAPPVPISPPIARPFVPCLPQTTDEGRVSPYVRTYLRRRRGRGASVRHASAKSVFDGPLPSAATGAYVRRAKQASSARSRVCTSADICGRVARGRSHRSPDGPYVVEALANLANEPCPESTRALESQIPAHPRPSARAFRREPAGPLPCTSSGLALHHREQPCPPPSAHLSTPSFFLLPRPPSSPGRRDHGRPRGAHNATSGHPRKRIANSE